jgi:hypothetical protein
MLRLAWVRASSWTVRAMPSVKGPPWAGSCGGDETCAAFLTALDSMLDGMLSEVDPAT